MSIKRALLIGINYNYTEAQLSGCIQDVQDMKKLLSSAGYAVCLMTDVEGLSPTRSNILSAMSTMVRNSRSGDQLYIHYSGHGAFIKDDSGDEWDGRDECICPLDSVTHGYPFITDDEIFATIVVPLPEGVKLRVVFDSCHSGSALDLPHRYNAGKFCKENENSGGDVIMVGAAKDDQTAADAKFDGRPNGALTWAFLKSVRDGMETWRDLADNMCKLLKRKQYTQVPQVSYIHQDAIDSPVDII